MKREKRPKTLLKQKNGLQADLERTRRTLAPVIRLQSISPKAFNDVLEQADQRADEIERARERVSERQRAEAEREQRAFLEQAGRDQVVKDFASLAARRQHRFHGFRDGGAKWEATPEPLRALVEGFNAMPKARQERVLQGLRRDPEKNAQIGGLLRERQQNIERGQDRGLSM